jgi:Delta7-sterol 5-desaturase
MEHHFQGWQVLLGSFTRYWIFAGITYLIFYNWKRNAFTAYKIQSSFPKWMVVKKEILYSMSTIVIFTAVVYTTIFSPVREYTAIYNNFHDHSGTYFILSLVAALLIHDTYFYWMHRFMHWKKVFRYVHKIHHHSHNPTPLAAFSFHPIEAALEIAIVPILVFTVPMHPFALAIFGTYNIAMNVIGHLGFEFFPKKFIKDPFFNLFLTSTHHNMHHHYSKGNYGLYFNIWDKILRTNHPDYEKTFEAIAEKKPGNSPSGDLSPQNTAKSQ